MMRPWRCGRPYKKEKFNGVDSVTVRFSLAKAFTAFSAIQLLSLRELRLCGASEKQGLVPKVPIDGFFGKQKPLDDRGFIDRIYK